MKRLATVTRVQRWQIGNAVEGVCVSSTTISDKKEKFEGRYAGSRAIAPTEPMGLIGCSGTRAKFAKCRARKINSHNGKWPEETINV